MLESRYYTIRGRKWEARFFRKGELFPDSELQVSKQGVWGKPIFVDWRESFYLGQSWRFINLDLDLLHLPEER